MRGIVIYRAGNKHLKMRQGSSIVEFLIWAPVLILICYAAYDLNKRVGESQSVEISIRNISSLGNPIPINSLANQPDTHNFSTQQAAEYMKNKSGIRDQSEIAQIMVAQTAGGTGLTSTLNRTISVSGDILSKNSAINPQGESTGFTTATATLGSAAYASAFAIEKIQGIGGGLGFLADNKVRERSLQFSLSGRANAIQGSMATTMALVSGKEEARNEVLGIDRRFAGRLFLRPEHGYHDSGFHNAGLYGMGLGLLKKNWGTGSDSRPKSKFLQRRCMSRFYSANDCDTRENYMMGIFEYPSDGFPVHIKRFAEAMYALSFAIKVIGATGVGAPAVGAEIAIKEGIDQIAASIGEQVFSAVLDTVKDKVTAPAAETVEEQLEEFKEMFEAPFEGVIGQLDPDIMLGGQHNDP